MELSAKNFKIGNFYLDENRDIVQMTGYALWQFSIKENQGKKDELKKFFTPILLTEEHLIKFGFIREENSPSEEHSNYFSIYIEDYKYSIAYANFREDWGLYIEYTDSPFPEDDNRKYPFYTGIKYVHELQNIPFIDSLIKY